MAENTEERELLAKNSTMESFRRVVENLRDRYLPYHEGKVVWKTTNESYDLELPPWLCQPYVRETPQEHINRVEAKRIELVSTYKQIFILISLIKLIFTVLAGDQWQKGNFRRRGK